MEVRVAGAGVSYLITDEAVTDLRATLKEVERSRLMTWIIDQVRGGVSTPFVDTSRLLAAKDMPPLSVAERVDRVILYLEQSLASIDDVLPLSATMIAASASGVVEPPSAIAGLKAWTESQRESEVTRLLDYAQQAGHLTYGTSVALTVDGWRYLDERRKVGAASDQAFVAMWFSKDMFKVYEDGIAPAVKAAGFRPLTIDKKDHNNKIDDEIIAEIRRSRFVVADFTCGTVTAADGKVVPVPRGGVYFEAGFAKGLGLEVIWAVRAGQIDDVHFDTRQYNHIVWDDAGDLREKLTNRIRAVVGQGPVK